MDASPATLTNVVTTATDAITVAQIIEVIERRQPVLNKDRLNDASLEQAIKGVANLATAGQGTLTFLSKDNYLKQLPNCAASVIIVAQRHAEQVTDKEDRTLLLVASPYLAYASCSELFDVSSISVNTTMSAADSQASKNTNTAKNTTIGKNVSIANNVSIGNNVVLADGVVLASGVCIADDVVIGAHTRVAANSSIGQGSIIGSHGLICANVAIAHDVRIGDYVRIHAGASIGSEGFGFAPTANPSVSCGTDNQLGGWQRIAQLGGVVIGHHVRIGANTCVDRGAIDDTIIADNVIIDNLVQVAHNVKIGAGTAIAASTAIAGSVTIGKNCIIGGAVGITGHLSIADNVTITARSLVTKSLDKAGSYSSGMPAVDTKTWRRLVARFRMMLK